MDMQNKIEELNIRGSKKPLTRAQEIFGREFGNMKVITDRPDELRSNDEAHDKTLYAQYRVIRRYQNKLIKNILR